MPVRIVPLSVTRAPSFRGPKRTTTPLTRGVGFAARCAAVRTTRCGLTSPRMLGNCTRCYCRLGTSDPPPVKWSALRHGFEPEEDRDGEQEAPARGLKACLQPWPSCG